MATTTTTFRVFLSSTFADLHRERAALQQHVFPRLRELCRANGFRFQAVDLRWGVSQEAALDQQTMRICLQEIARCQRLTPRPNFVVLLGDRYGWRPLPDEIPASRFAPIRTRLSGEDQALLDHWYRRDDNALPPAYLLQPRTGPSRDAATWDGIQHRLHSALASSTEALSLPPHERARYLSSAAEQEILQGALEVPDAGEHVFCFFRKLEDVDQVRLAASGLREARDLLDLESEGQPDHSGLERQRDLKRQLRERLPGNVHEYAAAWHDGSLSTRHLGALPEGVDECLALLEDPAPPSSLCVDVWRRLARVIVAQIGRYRARDPVTREREAHEEFGAERARRFTGRREQLDAIRSYGLRPGPRPLAVWGEPGSGKSALMASAANQARTALPAARLVLRFLGTTAASGDARSLLRSVCRELVAGEGGDPDEVPGDYRSLVGELATLLGRASAAQPVILFLDALDQLADPEGAGELAWLPVELPAHVRVIVSTSTGPTLSALRSRLRAEDLVEVGRLGDGDGATLLDAWLDDVNRRLQPEQRRHVLDAFGERGLPLYLRLAFDEARCWHSYDPPVPLQRDVAGLIETLLSRLAEEPKHGETMVSRSLGYLAAAPYGLAEDELLDVLSRDRNVLEDFRRRSPDSPPVTSLPVVVWSRLYAELEPYLTERQEAGVSLLAFFHRQFHEAVTRRYLRDPELRERHRALGAYFAEQPLESERVLSVLAFHLLQGQDLPGLSRLVRSPFLELKARTVGEPAAAEDARQIAAALAIGGEGYWDDLIACARTHCALVERIQANPESLEEVVSRGEVARVRALIRAEPDESRRALVALAASALLREGGHRDAGTRLFEEHLPVLVERLRLDPGEEGHIYRGHARAYGFEVHCIARALVESLQATEPAPPPPTAPAAPRGTALEPGPGPARTNVPLFETALALLASDRTAGVMTFGWLGLLFASGLVLALVTPDSFPLRLSPAGKILAVAAIIAPILLPFTLSSIAGKRLGRIGRTERVLGALANGWLSASVPQRRAIAFRALRYESVVGRSAEEGRSSPPLGDLVTGQLSLAQDPAELAEVLLALPASDEGLADHVAPVLRRLPPEALERVYGEVLAGAHRLRSKWQLLRIQLATADRAFNSELLLHCVISKDSEVQRYGVVGDLDPTIAELRGLSPRYLARTLLFTLRGAAAKPSRRKGMARWWTRTRWRAAEPLRVPLCAGERPLWMIMLLPAYLGAVLLGLGLIGAAAALFGGLWLAGRMHDAYRVAQLMRKQPAWPHRAAIEESADRLGLWLWETGSLRRPGLVGEAILARAILTGEPVAWSVDTNTSKLRAHRVLRELVKNGTLGRRGDLVTATMGDRRLLEVATAMSAQPGSAAPRRFGPEEHERYLRRALPQGSAWGNLVVVLIAAVLGTVIWSAVLGALQPGGPLPRGGRFVATALLLSAVLAVLQHVGRRPLGVLRDDPTLWYGFRGVVVWIAFFLLLGFVVNRLGSGHGLTTPDTRVMIELLIGPLLITNFLVPEVVAAWRGAGLSYPRPGRLAWRRLVSFPCFAAGCVAVALLVAGLGAAAAAIERAFA